MSTKFTMKDVIAAKSDQLNAIDLVGGPMILEITAVRIEHDGKGFKLVINYAGDNGKPYKANKSMSRILADQKAWGMDENTYVGKFIEVFREPTVIYGGKQEGGIRISRISGIERAVEFKIVITRGKTETIVVRPLVAGVDYNAAQTVAPAVTDEEIDGAMARLTVAANLGMAELGAAWKKIPAPIRKAMNDKCPDSLKAVAAAVDKQAAAPEQDNG